MMDDKQLEFLNAIEKIDWSSRVANPGQYMSTKEKPQLKALKLSKGQKRRAQKRLKKNPTGLKPNIAAKKNVETIVFNNPDNNNLTTESNYKKTKKNQNPTTDTEVGIDIDLKKTRFEVMKFGMHAMSGSEKVDAETALAISLGARPAKKSYMNYKELSVQRKAEKEKELEDEERKKKSVKPTNKKNKKDQRKNSSSKKDTGIISAKKIINSSKFKQPKSHIGKKNKK